MKKDWLEIICDKEGNCFKLSSNPAIKVELRQRLLKFNSGFEVEMLGKKIKDLSELQGLS